MELRDLQAALFAAKAEVDQALVQYEEAIAEDAIADDEARRAKARSYLTSREQLGGKATVSAIEASVDLETADKQKRARLAEGLKRSAGKAVDAKLAWMSSLQSLSSTMRAEMRLATYEPSETRSA